MGTQEIWARGHIRDMVTWAHKARELKFFLLMISYLKLLSSVSTNVLKSKNSNFTPPGVLTPLVGRRTVTGLGTEFKTV